MTNGFKEKYFPTISLFAICLVTTFLLALVYSVTKDTIAVRAEEAAGEARMAVMADADRFELLEGEEAADTEGVILAVYGAYSGSELVGYVFDAETNGYGAAIRSIIGVTADKTEISGLRITESSETPGLGAHIADANFYEQFAGTGGTGATLTVVKLVTDPNSEIEAISAATISSNAVTRAANAALRTAQILVEKGVGK